MSYNKEYYQKNRDRLLKQFKAFRERNPDYAREWYLANRELVLVNGRKWREKNPNRMEYLNQKNYRKNGEHIRALVKEWADANPEKKFAQNIVTKNIQRGSLIRADTCMNCGHKGRTEAHHKDYNQPLEVIWLCRSCHKRIHTGTLELVS